MCIRCKIKVKAQTYSFDLESWRPLVLEDIKADATELVDVWMVDLSSEENLWWDHRVFLGEEELKVKHTAFKRCITWTGDLDIEMSAVCLRGLCVNAHNYNKTSQKLYSCAARVDCKTLRSSYLVLKPISEFPIQ